MPIFYILYCGFMSLKIFHKGLHMIIAKSFPFYQCWIIQPHPYPKWGIWLRQDWPAISYTRILIYSSASAAIREWVEIWVSISAHLQFRLFGTKEARTSFHVFHRCELNKLMSVQIKCYHVICSYYGKSLKCFK